jgi:hypothetical protein
MYSKLLMLMNASCRQRAQRACTRTESCLVCESLALPTAVCTSSISRAILISEDQNLLCCSLDHISWGRIVKIVSESRQKQTRLKKRRESEEAEAAVADIYIEITRAIFHVETHLERRKLGQLRKKQMPFSNREKPATV